MQYGDEILRIYHEHQSSQLCVRHCLNNLLQGPYFTEFDLSKIALDLDKEEQALLAQDCDEHNGLIEWLKHNKQSQNVSDDGNFSIQVLRRALSNLGLKIFHFGHEQVKQTQQHPENEQGFICNLQAHWFGIRRIGSIWYNLNSLSGLPETKAVPTVISNFYLSAFLSTLQNDGYSIFVVKSDNWPHLNSYDPYQLLPDYAKWRAADTIKSRNGQNVTEMGWGNTNNKQVHQNFLKNIKQETKQTVFGFVRNLGLCVPAEVTHMCILYYYIPEYFTTHGSHMAIYDSGQTAEHDNKPYHGQTAEPLDELPLDECIYSNTAYGNMNINQQEYRKCVWTFKINKPNDEVTLCIGIDSSNKNCTEGSFCDDDEAAGGYGELVFDAAGGESCNYGYCSGSDGAKIMCKVTKVTYCDYGTDLQDFVYMKDYGCTWGDDDIVTMEFDVENKTLKYYINSKDQGIAVKNVLFNNNQTYNMAICINKQATINMINFEAIYK